MLDRGRAVAPARRRRPTRRGGARSATPRGRWCRATCAAASSSGCSPTAASTCRSTRRRRAPSSRCSRAATSRASRSACSTPTSTTPHERRLRELAQRGPRRRPGLDLLGDLAAREGVRARVDDRDRRLHEADLHPLRARARRRAAARRASPARSTSPTARRRCCRGREALEKPFRIVFAGPAAGTMSSASLGEAIGERNLICCDVGGTSTDISLVRRRPAVRQQHLRARARPHHQRALDRDLERRRGRRQHRLDLALRRRARRARQRGLGSRARLLRPRRHAPTMTDACLLMGILDPDDFAGGRDPPRRRRGASARSSRSRRTLRVERADRLRLPHRASPTSPRRSRTSRSATAPTRATSA